MVVVFVPTCANLRVRVNDKTSGKGIARVEQRLGTVPYVHIALRQKLRRCVFAILGEEISFSC